MPLLRPHGPRSRAGPSWPTTLVALAVGLGLSLVAASPALAHGPVPDDAPTIGSLLLGWSFEPAVWLPLVAAAAGWAALVRRVNRVHAEHPVPRVRSVAWFAGLAAIAIALQSGIERYDTSLFSIHMVQHLLLTMVAAPLLALAAPITLLLRAASPDRRRSTLLPLLHSRAVRVIAHPVLTSLLFAGVMWGTHFSPLFDQALEDRLAHDLEHVLFLGTALLFWWPAVGLDPGPYRMTPPIRVLYTFLQMPQNTFLAVAITFAPAPLYAHYATLARPWGPDPLLDQQIAGAIMWVGGDLLFLAAILALVVDWSRREERDTAAAERRADRRRAEIKARETAFAARRAAAAARPTDAEPTGTKGTAPAASSRGAEPRSKPGA